jgi:hypothetical protein
MGFTLLLERLEVVALESVHTFRRLSQSKLFYLFLLSFVSNCYLHHENYEQGYKHLRSPWFEKNMGSDGMGVHNSIDPAAVYGSHNRSS